MMSEMRAVEKIARRPARRGGRARSTASIRDRDALVLIASVEASTRLGDRPAFGPRRPAWVALEDKTVCDALFDAAGVPRPPSRVVAATSRALRDAAAAARHRCRQRVGRRRARRLQRWRHLRALGPRRRRRRRRDRVLRAALRQRAGRPVRRGALVQRARLRHRRRCRDLPPRRAGEPAAADRRPAAVRRVRDVLGSRRHRTGSRCARRPGGSAST